MHTPHQLKTTDSFAQLDMPHTNQIYRHPQKTVTSTTTFLI